MSKEKKRKRHLNTGSQKLRMTPALRLILVTGSSVLLITICFILYFNFSRVQLSKAGVIRDRIIPAASLQTDMDVRSVIILPVAEQPVKKGEHGIINKRRMNTNPDQH